MSWKIYEHKVLEKLRELYPNSEVFYNVGIKGFKSGRSRQIDTLIINRIGNTEIKTVVDSKLFGKKIDIKTVESFIGFLSDVQADRGIIVTEVGYTKSAYRRAQNEESEIELKILTMEELPDFVGFCAIMKMGPVDCFFEVHPKWIINSKNPTVDALAKIYPNKYDWNTALKNHEYIYGTILVHVNENHELPPDFNYEIIIKQINDALFEKNINLNKIEITTFVELDGEPVGLHECKMNEFSEYLAVAHFNNYSIIFGLVTPNNKVEENLEALGFTVSQIRTMFTNYPGLPNISEMFFNFKEYSWVKQNETPKRID